MGEDIEGGSAEIIPIGAVYRPRPDGALCDLLVRHAETVRACVERDETGSPMVGFFVLGVCEDGSYSSGWRVLDGCKSLSATLLGALVCEIARREIITQSEVVSVLNRKADDDE